MKAIADWAKTVGREKDISPELVEIARSNQLSDDEVNRKLAAMKSARDARNFAQSDAIRAELVAAGILVKSAGLTHLTAAGEYLHAPVRAGMEDVRA